MLCNLQIGKFLPRKCAIQFDIASKGYHFLRDFIENQPHRGFVAVGVLHAARRVEFSD